MKLSEYREELRDMLQEPDPEGRFTDLSLNRHINRSMSEVAKQLDIVYRDTLITFTSGDTIKPLPGDLLSVKRVSISGRPLSGMMAELLDVENPGWETLAGIPTGYMKLGSSLRLYPIPESDTTVSLWYTAIPTRLVNDQDESELPDWCDEGVLLYALHLARNSDGDPRAEVDFQKWNVWLMEAQKLVRRSTVTQTTRIKAERQHRWR